MEGLPLAPYREIGLACEGPASVYAIGAKAYLLAATGRSYKVYALPSLKIKLLGPTLGEPLRFVHAWNEFAFLFDASTAHKFHFQHVVASRRLGEITAVLGIDREMFVLCEGRRLLRLDAELQTTDSCDLPFLAEHVIHPATYLNKLLFYAPRQLVLFNVSAKRVVFDFFTDAGFAEQLGGEELALVVAVGSADLAALGCRSGLVALANLRTAEVLTSFTLNEPVRALCFLGEERVFAASEEFFATFDCEQNALQLLPLKARYSLLQVLDFEDQQLLVAGSAADNLLHVFSLELASAPRLLRSRQGAARPLRKVRFFGKRRVLAAVDAAQNSVFSFSLHNDAASLPMSDKRNGTGTEPTLNSGHPLELATDPLCADNVRVQLFTSHAQSSLPVAWDVRKGRRAKFFLERSSAMRFHADPLHAPWVARPQPVSALALSPAGAFLFIGYADGSLIKVAGQSGGFQSAFSPPPLPGPVLALAINSHSSCVWALARDRLFGLDFFSGQSLFSAETPGARQGFFDAQNELALLAGEGGLRLFSCSTREFTASFAAGEVTDAAFLPRARKVIWAESDGRLVLADTLFGEVQFIYSLTRPVVSLAVNEGLGLLCTVSTGQREIALWHVVDVHRRAKEPLHVTFASPVRQLRKDLRAQYLGAAAAPAAAATDVADPLLAAVSAFVAAQHPARLFSSKDASYLRAVRFADRRRVADLDAEMLIEPPALPFFLDFDAPAAAAKSAQPATSSALEGNALMATHLVDAEQLVAQIDLVESADNSAIFRALLERVEGMSAAEADSLFKRAAFFSPEDSQRLLRFLCAEGLPADLANCLLASFLPAAAPALLQTDRAALRAALQTLSATVQAQQRRFADRALQLQAVCEGIARSAI